MRYSRDYPIYRRQRKLYEEGTRKALFREEEWENIFLAKI
jgi:hypothetical protein